MLLKIRENEISKTSENVLSAKNCRKHSSESKQLKNKARPKTKKNALNKGARRVFKIMAGYGGMPRLRLLQT